MTPNFIELPARKFVGMGARFIPAMSPQHNNASVIPPLWHRFIQRIESIPRRVGQRSFGLVEELPRGAVNEKGEMFYVAAVEVNDFDSVAAGMERREIAAGRYAMFTHNGKLDSLVRTIKAIYAEWAPANRSILREGPHIEVYDGRFNAESDNSEFDILLPVKQGA